jgi:hypothetical protein
MKNSSKRKIRNDPADANILFMPFIDIGESENDE